MPSARYWRITSVVTYAGGDLELSEVALYEGATRVFGAVTSTVAPVSGSLADLSDDGFGTSVTWDGKKVILPGFAIVFDMGAPVNVTSAGVAGPSHAAFPAVLILEYSSDGAQWARSGTMQFDYVSSAYISAPVYMDPFADKVTLRLSAGASNSIVDTSQFARSVSVVGANQGSSNNGMLEPYCWSFSGGHLGVAYADGLNFRDSDFCLEGRAVLDAGKTGYMGVVDLRGSAAWNASWTLFIDPPNRSFNIYDGTINSTFLSTGLNALPPAGTWFHWRVSRSGSTTFINIEGVVYGAANWNPPNTAASGIRIGASQNNDQFFYGRMEKLRFTKSESRGTLGFYPLDAVSVDSAVPPKMPRRTPAANPVLIGEQVLGATQPLTGAPPSQFDIYDAGRGRIVGTVKEKNTPTNIPLKRRVVLLSMPGSRAIRETWSDPTTGSYAFTEVAMDRVYTVVSYDHTGIYRGVVADNLTPELMP